jgi:transposase IS66 family protein
VRPILAKLQAYLQEQQAAALPKSPLGATIGYALRNWVALMRYAEDGQLKIGNNGAEQALPTAVPGGPWRLSGRASGARPPCGASRRVCELRQDSRLSSSIRAFASLRSSVSKPSVNQL